MKSEDLEMLLQVQGKIKIFFLDFCSKVLFFNTTVTVTFKTNGNTEFQLKTSKKLFLQSMHIGALNTFRKSYKLKNCSKELGVQKDKKLSNMSKDQVQHTQEF